METMPSSTPPVWWQILIQALTFLATISVTILAVFGDWFRNRLAGPRLTILPSNNFRGAVVPRNDGRRSIYYHVLVNNSRTWAPAKNCRVLLCRIERRGPDGSFHDVPLSVPMQFVWSIPLVSPLQPTITKYCSLDFGHVDEGTAEFVPELYARTNDFTGGVHAGEAVRYHLEVASDSFASPAPHVIEVAWDGQWSDNLDQMSRSLTIKQVS